uniref:Uncharacterized protein n=1 Tax=Rhizophagus irregularis (strain DAOM 181602 / DAOM 197198 / MUCL 43194) TaxID=747089 RepID=U9U3Y6_RHIID
MNYLIRLLFILNLYTFFISDIFACKCAKPDSYGSVSTYCGGELQMHGGGSTAKLISLCGYSCCKNNFDYSKCYIGNGYFNKCDETYLPKSAKSVTTNPISSTTNTDSLNVITQFEKLKKSRFSQTSREYFKANNNFLWAILCRIILTLNLHVEMFKVVAHGDDMGSLYSFSTGRLYDESSSLLEWDYY